MSLYPFFRPRPVSMLGELMRDLWRVERQMNALDFPMIQNSSPVFNRGFLNEISNDENKFAINMNVQQFKPEELKIDLDGRKLRIEGIQETNNDDGYSKRSFCRVVVLPDDVDLSSVSSNLSNDGNLSIEVPKMERMKGRSIPIQQSNANPAITEKKNEEKSAEKTE